MADGITKRMNYFDRQFLRAKDFQDEQAYHIDRRRRHARLLHTPGIAEGLEVEGALGQDSVTITPGTAIDAEGREIVLAQPQTLSLRNDADEIDLLILYDEKETDSRFEGGVEGSTRMEESPAFVQQRLAPIPPEPEPKPPLGVLLAKITMENGKIKEVIDDVRERAGTAISGNLAVRKLSLKRNDVDPANWPELSCSKANEASLEGSLHIINGGLRIGDGNEMIRVVETFKELQAENEKLKEKIDGLEERIKALEKKPKTAKAK